MTDQAIAPPRGAKYSIGNVLSTSFSLLWSNQLKFLAVPALIMIPAFVALVGFSVYVFAVTVPALQQGAIAPGPFFLALLAMFVLLMIASSLTTAATTSAAFQALRGEKVRLGASFKRGFAAVLPVSIGGIVVGFCVLIGFVLLIVPGLFLLAAFWLFVPAIVVEGKGIGGGISRSMALTKGHMWSVLALVVIVLAANLVLHYVDSHVVGPLFGGVASGICSLVVIVVVQAFNAIAVTVTYYFLRADKEGVDIDNIAKVFD